MEHLGLLIDVVVVLGAALSLGLLLARLGQSPIVGYLVAGVVVGPGGLALLRDPTEVGLLAELGVALLLFTIGLEFSWQRLRALGPVAGLGGTLQIVLTGAIAALAATALGASARASAVFGMIIALSSTAVVFRILAERAEIDSVPGRVVVGILLLQDIAVVPLVLLVPVLAGTGIEGGVVAQLGGTLLRGVVLIAAMVAAARLVLPPLFNAAAINSRELFIILGLTFCLAATWAADAWGLSPVLGAFVAGVLLADSRFAGQIRADMGPLRAGFVAFFFVSIGMFAEPVWIARHALAVGSLVAAILVGKTLVTGLVVRLFGYPPRTAMVSALALAQIGELSFVVADLARGHGIIGGEAFQLIVSASVVSLMLTPYAIALGRHASALLPARRARWRDPRHMADEEGRHRRSGHVIVVGYGPTGARVVEALQEVGTPHLVVELNPRTVTAVRSRGVEIEFGDASQEEILREAGIRGALALVITVPDPAAAATIAHAAKSIRPELPVVARARYAKYIRDLARSGADIMANEEEMMGERLAGVTLRLVGIASEAVARIRHEEEEVVAPASSGEAAHESGEGSAE